MVGKISSKMAICGSLPKSNVAAQQILQFILVGKVPVTNEIEGIDKKSQLENICIDANPWGKNSQYCNMTVIY